MGVSATVHSFRHSGASPTLRRESCRRSRESRALRGDSLVSHPASHRPRGESADVRRESRDAMEESGKMYWESGKPSGESGFSPLEA